MDPDVVTPFVHFSIQEVRIIHGKGPGSISGGEVPLPRGPSKEVYAFRSFLITTHLFVPRALTRGAFEGGHKIIVPGKLINEESLRSLFHQNNVVQIGLGRDKQIGW
jgi:hypothetical protein